MDADLLVQFKDLGFAAVLMFSALGSACGACVAALSAIGAWKKCFAQNKMAPFMLVAFVGAPLSQTIYSMIVMNNLIEVAQKGHYMWSLGILAGLSMGASAYFQGKAGASAADSMGETGKGFGNYLVVIGIIETVALFIMVFSLMAIGRFKVGL